MAGWHLDTKMAQDIVARTMRIIDTNINVMDARGRIIGSGDREAVTASRDPQAVHCTRLHHQREVLSELPQKVLGTHAKAQG